MVPAPQLLSDPFLQMPTETSGRVVWFTEFAGQHTVSYGQDYARHAVATTTKLSRTREDQRSQVGQAAQSPEPTMRDIWRHEAEVTGLTPGTRIPYRVTSVREDGKMANSSEFTLSPKPIPGKPLKILLTSDHQLKPMTAANLQKVVETIGRVDAVFFAGDLVNVPDRASEWFDDNRGGALFPCLQGRASYEMNHNGIKTLYTGGQLIQHAPMFTAIGNREVMGRRSKDGNLDHEFGDAVPRAAALKVWQAMSLSSKDRETPTAWLKDNSFDTDTYEEIFTLPESQDGGKRYYAVSLGDVRLVVLYATNLWGSPNLDAAEAGVRGGQVR